MSAEGEESEDDKPYEPTQKRLEDARREGEVPSSADLTTTAAYAGLILAALTAGGDAVSASSAVFVTLLAQADVLSEELFSGSGMTMSGALLVEVGWTNVVWFLLPLACAVAAIVAQRAFVVAPARIRPKLSRISPIDMARQKFGRTGLFEFLKSFVKLVAFSVTLGLFLWNQLPAIVSMPAAQPGEIVIQSLRLSVAFLAIVVAVSLLLGLVDLGWQHADHLRRHRMSRKELQDELKEMEGDPYLKQARRQRGYDIATNRMLADVPSADVIIVNPIHYAVALRWTRGSDSAPVCVAKGVDEIAHRIREIASESGVPIHRDPPTARALHASVSLGQEIRPEHFRPVAAAIRFAETMRRRARWTPGRETLR
jgi:flagellar biosynthetic protein FlhB